MPKADVIKEGHKFPFNASELLISFDDDNVLETTYQKPQKRLGLAKFTQVEYIRSILDVIINANAIGVLSKEIAELILIIKEKGVFWNLIDIFFTFEYNNMFQTLFRQIMDIVTNEFS